APGQLPRRRPRSRHPADRGIPHRRAVEGRAAARGLRRRRALSGRGRAPRQLPGIRRGSRLRPPPAAVRRRRQAVDSLNPRAQTGYTAAVRIPWRPMGCWSAAVVLLLGCGSTSKPLERPGMVYIPPGEFLMGSAADDPAVYDWERPHEQPQHPVWVDGFYIDVHEVTNAEFDRVMPGHQRHEASSCDDCPVTQLSWFSADAYCRKQTPPKRLPTEAEWEKAAKGGLPAWNPEPFE